MSGRLALSEGTTMLRDAIQEALRGGNKKILLNMEGVNYMDSAEIGELVRSMTSSRRSAGQLRLVSPSRNVLDMLKTTKLDRVFDIDANEADAIRAAD